MQKSFTDGIIYCAVFVGVLSCTGCARTFDKQVADSPRELWKAPVSEVVRPEATAPEASSVADGHESGPYDLSTALDTALMNNPSTRAAWFSAKAAAAAREKANADYYPHVNGTVDYQRSKSEFPVTSGFPGGPFVAENTIAKPALSVTYTLFDFGARNAAARAARENLVAANYSYNRTLQQLVFEVQRRYYLLYAAQAQVVASEESIRDASRNFEAAERSFNIGSKPKQDELQAEATLRRAEFNLESAKSAVEDARANFAAVLGKRITREISIVAPNFDRLNLKRSSDDPSVLVAAALKARPDLQADFAQARLQKAERAVAERQALPKLVGTANADRQYIRGIDGNENEYTVGVQVQIPIFLGFQNYYSIKQASEEYAQAQEQTRAKELSVATEVWSAFFNFEASEHQMQSAHTLLRATSESYRALQTGYANGSNSVLDLLASQQDQSNAKQSLIAAQTNWAISLAQLQLACGDLPK